MEDRMKCIICGEELDDFANVAECINRDCPLFRHVFYINQAQALDEKREEHEVIKVKYDICQTLFTLIEEVKCDVEKERDEAREWARKMKAERDFWEEAFYQDESVGSDAT